MQGLLANLSTQYLSFKFISKKQIKNLVLISGISLALVSCGGGGSGGALPDAAAEDKVGPKILATEPLNNEIDVLVGLTQFTITFDELLNKDSILPGNILIQEIDNNGEVVPNSVVALINESPFNYLESKNKLIISTVQGSLKANKTYQVEIKNFVDDLGNSMAVTTTTFSTTKLPTVFKITPLNNAIPVSVAQKIIIEFDEAMDETSLKTGFTLTETLANSTGSKVYQFSATDSPLMLEHQIVDNKSIAAYFLVEPSTQVTKEFEKTAQYTIKLLATATDLKGNSIGTTTSQFTTGVSNQTGTPAAKPGTVTAVTKNNGGSFDNVISWKAEVKVAYNLYVSIDDGFFLPVVTTPLFDTPFVAGDITYTDKNVTTDSKYIYAVSAVEIITTNLYGPESPFSQSNSVVVGVQAPQALTAIAGPDTNVADGDVKLVWDSIIDYRYNLYVSINGSALSIFKTNIVATQVQRRNYIRFKYR